MTQKYDVIIIGGGFFGVSIALLMKEYYKNVLIIEKNSDLLKRASFINQARIHGGYHYPRSLVTARRSAANLPRFMSDFKECVYDSCEKLYAIARKNSKVDAYHFKKFCTHAGAPIEQASKKFKDLFDSDFIEDVFMVKESVFDADKLRNVLHERLKKADIHCLYNTEVKKIEQNTDTSIRIILSDESFLEAKKVFNCTYSNINTLLRSSNLPLIPFKHEFTEMALIDVPQELENLAITVMDGPFFSIMPFPAKKLYTLSHVRYTPHFSWRDDDVNSAPKNYTTQKKSSHYPYMIKDAIRYLPVLSKTRYIDSLFETKTVLLENEMDDGRPILLKKDYGMKNLFVVMGAKIDNIYDVLETLTLMERNAHVTSKQ